MWTYAIKHMSVRLTAVIMIVVLVQLALCGICKAEPSKGQRPAAIDVSTSDDIDRRPFLDYVRQRGQLPIEYVVSKFTKHDVVLSCLGWRICYKTLSYKTDRPSLSRNFNAMMKYPD